MFVYDFDCPDEWVGRFIKLVEPKATSILKEIKEQTAWELSGSDIRFTTANPPAPEKDLLLATISTDFSNSAFRAFHATRLLRPTAILDEGLLALDRRVQIDRVLDATSAPGCTARRANRSAAWAGWSEENDTLDTRYREGDCWLTPSRSFLHDGGLDLMFERFGGEFTERISGDPYKPTLQPQSDVGHPTVVVAAIPARWCRWAPRSGPLRILYETMARLGHSLQDSFAPFWDVQVNQSLPPNVIEFVCDRHDERVAHPLAAS